MNQAAARPGGGNGKAALIGFGAMLLGAVIWAVVTALTKHEFSAVAIGVGALIGLSMFTARPTSGGIALLAALLTIVGCALGELLAVAALVTHDTGASFTAALNAEAKHLGQVFTAFGGKTYLFWLIGALAAFSMTFRRIRAARAMPVPPVAAAAQYPQFGPQPGTPGYGQGAAPYGQAAPGGQPPSYGQQQYPPQGQPYGQGQNPYAQPPQQGQQPPYPQQPGYGQQYPPR